MTYDLDYTLAPFNINVNVIVPGLIRTAFYDRLVGFMKEEDKDKDAFLPVWPKWCL
jgi:NAD(P)-dependent dehydrogenase (short-subunit alcohol dehydrogenase family)